MPNKPDLMRLSAALLTSVLLHAGLGLLTWHGPTQPAVDYASTAPALPLTARLLPSTQGAAPPRPPAATPRAPKPPPTRAEPAPNEASRTAQRTRQPYPLEPVNLDIPEASLPTVHGTLVLKLWIDEKGQVVAYEPEPTDLPVEYVRAVGDTLTSVRFAPALRDGHPVAAIYRIEIDAEAAEQKP